MPRSVNHVASRRRRKRILNQTKGYVGARRNVWTVAKNSWEKGLQYAYRDRKTKKRNFRKLWIQRINAAARQEGMTYSSFMGALKKSNIEINRKVLADLAMNHPEAFSAIVDKAKNGSQPTKKVEKTEPKKAEPKKAEAEKEEPKKAEAEKVEPKKAEAKKTEAEKAE